MPRAGPFICQSVAHYLELVVKLSKNTIVDFKIFHPILVLVIGKRIQSKKTDYHRIVISIALFLSLFFSLCCGIYCGLLEILRRIIIFQFASLSSICDSTLQPWPRQSHCKHQRKCSKNNSNNKTIPNGNSVRSYHQRRNRRMELVTCSNAFSYQFRNILGSLSYG